VSALARGLGVAGIHFLIVLSMGGKLLYDRSVRPRAWAQTEPFDPSLPIRGRYVSLAVLVPMDETPRSGALAENATVRLDSLQGELTASVEVGSAAWKPPCERNDVERLSGPPARYRLRCPVLYFLPEHVVDPSMRQPQEQLWVELTIPRKGPPRPIRLGVRRGSGNIEPLEID
jgi:hypothetical protein